MKIFPITYAVQKTNISPNQIKRKKTQNDTFISFRGKQYPSGYYTDEEIVYAKKYLGNEDWEQEYFKKRYEQIYPQREVTKAEVIFNIFTGGIPILTEVFVVEPAKEKKVKNKIAPELRRIRSLMIDLNNEKIRKLQKEEEERKLKQEALERQIKLKELEKRKKRNEEQINSKITERLSNAFINPLKDNSEQIPSTIMLESTRADKRKEITQWLKDEVNAKIVSFKLPDSEDDALYRLNTELEYAQENYEKTGKRTVLFIDDFSRILDASKVSKETIAEMKAFLYSLSEDKEPMTIVFDVSNTNNIDKAFLGNKRRIPLQLNLDDLMLGQKRDWGLGLDKNIKNMDDWHLEVHKCWLSQNVENAIRQKDYRRVIELKETIALICEMQGKQRDAYLLRVDIDNYLKKI